MEAENARLSEEAIIKARKEWQDERPSDFDDQLASARKEWLKNHNDDLEKRLSNTIEEVRRIWDEEQKQKTKEVTVEVILGQSFKNTQEERKRKKTPTVLFVTVDVLFAMPDLHYYHPTSGLMQILHFNWLRY